MTTPRRAENSGGERGCEAEAGQGTASDCLSLFDQLDRLTGRSIFDQQMFDLEYQQPNMGGSQC
jgi:hypothetical protein